jgi:hypothetical protein
MSKPDPWRTAAHELAHAAAGLVAFAKSLAVELLEPGADGRPDAIDRQVAGQLAALSACVESKLVAVAQAERDERIDQLFNPGAEP